jgi:hypothetical protein
MSELVGIPAPPPGPGVAPPFAAPPRDRDTKRLWIGLGIGGFVLILACVGGVLGIGLLASGSEDLVRGQATSVVNTYLSALRDRQYQSAWREVCTNLTSRHSLAEFRAAVGDPPTGYSVDAVDIQADTIIVQATLRNDTGTKQVQYPIVQDGTTLRICGGIF